MNGGAFSIGQDVATTSNVRFNRVNANVTGNVTGTVSSIANHDTGDLDEGGVAELFGKTQGFKADDPNVTPSEEVAIDDDF